jgi:uncharacterized protein YdhG (YjbR/CyaY superfamily)
MHYREVMMERTTVSSIDAYITAFPQEVQAKLVEMRTIISETAPNSSETISYAIPTFDFMGKHLVHFAAFKQHIGFYPTASGIAQFARDLEPYKTSKGAVQFPLEQPLPEALIARIVRFRVTEIMASPQKKCRQRSRPVKTNI